MQAQGEWLAKVKSVVEARVIELSLQLTRAHVQVEEVEQYLVKAYKKAEAETSKLSLDLRLGASLYQRS